MPTQPDSKLWTRPGLLALLFITLLAPLFLSGCYTIFFRILDDRFGSTSSSGKSSYECNYVNAVKETTQTPYGWVSIYTLREYCNGYYDRDTSPWVSASVIFTKEKPGDLRDSRIQYPVSSDKLRTVPYGIKNLNVGVVAPHWLRISVEREDRRETLELNTWDYLISNNGNKKTSIMLCDDIFIDKDGYDYNPNIEICAESPDARWIRIAKQLNNRSMLDDVALQWIVAHRDDSAEVISALKYVFAQTWEEASGERTAETIATLLDIIPELDCSAVLVSDQWKDYLDAIDVILTPELKANTLERCVGPLNADQSARLKMTQTQFITPRALEVIDTEVLARINSGKVFNWTMWFERLEELPAPSDELITWVDEYLFEQLPESSKNIETRLMYPTPISPANVTLLLEQTVAESTDKAYFISAIVKRPEIAAHRDALAQVWTDALAAKNISQSMREAFELCLTSLHSDLQNPGGSERLKDVLVANIDLCADDTIATHLSTDEAAHQALLKRFDNLVAKNFPLGSEYFLKTRLSNAERSVTDAILARARAMKNNNISFDQAPCEIVRRLMFLPISEDECVIPDNL